MKTVLITGGSSGIGLEFCRQYLHRGYQVVAASRNPEKSNELGQLKAEYNDHLVILKLDVGDVESRCSFYKTLSSKTGKLDILINSAGIISGNEQFCYPFGRLRQEDLCKTLLINSVAPLMMVEKVLPMLVKGSRPLVVNITSDNGSIARKNSRGKYGYSASKAAVNMITKILSIELREHEVIVVSLHPGWVKTKMTQNENAPLEPVDSIDGMLRVIESLEMQDSGRFLDWRGDEIPW